MILASLSSWGCGYNEVCLTTISVVENFSDVPETCPESQHPVCISLLWNFSPWFHFLPSSTGSAACSPLPPGGSSPEVKIEV